MTDTGLLVNLAIALALGFLGALLAVRLRQSIILGYVLAGMLIGPFTPGFVGDPATVDALANIGIILLMFTIGVQLSFRDLLRAGMVATVGGSIQVLATIGIGYLVGIALGWQPVEALFFGAVISNSSSTVLSKILAERGETGAEHGRIALAWSTVQDLSTIVLVVILSALATDSEALLPELLWATGKAILFLILLIPIGSWVFPRLFERVAGLRSREIFIVLVAAVALGTAYISSLFGLSLALGAFVAGVVISESELSDQILGEVTPLRDIFAGLFFVSIGMFVDPVFIVMNFPLVLLALALIVVAKGLLTFAITLLFRASVRTALLTGVTLAQSAEFSFLLARLGASLGAVTPSVFSTMLAAAAASIVLAPALHTVAAPAARWVEKHLPPSPLATHPVLTSERPPRRHAVLCGYGHVGSMIGVVLRRRGFSLVIIEQDPRVVRLLRDEGMVALLGNADNPVLLDLASVSQARVLIVTIPDILATRLIVQHARRVNPRLAIVVRTHSEEEREYLETLGVGEAVVGEREMALEITRYTLQRFGVSTHETQAIVQHLRFQAEETGTTDL